MIPGDPHGPSMNQTGTHRTDEWLTLKDTREKETKEKATGVKERGVMVTKENEINQYVTLFDIKLTQYIEIQQDSRCGLFSIINALDLATHPNKPTDNELQHIAINISNQFFLLQH